MSSLITQSEFLTWATGDPADRPDLADWLQTLIDGAQAKLERYCRRTFTGTTVEHADQLYDGTGGVIIRLRDVDVTAVSAVAVEDSNGEFEAVDTDAWRFYAVGDLVRVDGLPWPVGNQNVRVTLSVRTADPAMKQAKIGALLLVGHVWFGSGHEPAAGTQAAAGYSRSAMDRIDPASGLPLPVLTWVKDLRRQLTAVV